MNGVRNFGFARITSFLVLLSFFTRGLGFVKEILVAATFGLGVMMDAYVAALLIPTLITGILMSALQSALVPQYLEIESARGRDEADSFLCTVLVVGAVIGTIGAFVLSLADSFIIKLAMPGFSGERLELAGQLLRLLAFMLPVNIIIGLLNTYANIHKSFLLPTLAALPSTLCVMGFVYWGATFWGIHAYAFGLLVGSLIQIIIIAGVVVIVAPPKLRIRFEQGDLVALGVLLLSPFVGSIFSHLNEFVDQFMISHLQAGANSALFLSFRLIGVPLDIVILSISTVVFPLMARSAVERDHVALARHYYNAVQLASLLLVPLVILILILPSEVIITFFMRGAFSLESVELAIPTLMTFGVGLIPMAVGIISARIFNALKISHLLAYMGAVNIFINIFLNFAFIPLLGHSGVSLSTSIAYLIGTLVFNTYLAKYYMGFSWRQLSSAVLPYVIYGVAASVCVLPFCSLIRAYEWPAQAVLAAGSFLLFVLYVGILIVRKDANISALLSALSLKRLEVTNEN